MIVFKSVSWKNFLSTGNSSNKVLLNKSQTTLIIGKNGEGKSTILDALCFSLFGKNLGTSFQLIDDALDYSGNSENLGKSTGDDFYDGKITLPVIISFEEANENEKYIWKEIFQKKVRNKKDLSTANNLIEKHKSIEKTMHLANKYGNKAKKRSNPSR